MGPIHRLALAAAAVTLLAACGSGTKAADPGLPHVIVVSVDGLRPDAVTQLGAEQAPNLHRFLTEGAATSNGRTDFTLTTTLPNHAGMLTGRRVAGSDGHGLTINIDSGSQGGASRY